MRSYEYLESSRNALSVRAYNLTIGFALLWGFVINAIMCTYCTPIFMEWNFTAVIIGYFITAIIGIYMSKLSENALVSFIGYNLVVLPVGVVLSIALIDVDKVSIMHAIVITAILTGIMIVLSGFFPDFFLSLGRTLFTCLSVVIVCELLCLMFGIYTPTIWDVLVALLFCGYIGYDWVEAQHKTKTLDNAIDSVVGLYLDIINLFLRVLSSSSKSSSKD